MATPSRSTLNVPFTLDTPTALSFLTVFSLLPIAQLTARSLIPNHRLKYIFTWLLFDFLTHTILEGSYLYHVFCSYITVSDLHPASLGRSEFLGRSDRRYGVMYSRGPMARLWMEYAKSDARWAGSDLGVISVELATVLLEGPMALYVCSLILRLANVEAESKHQSKRDGTTKNTVSNSRLVKAGLEADLWFWIIVLSVAEIYGCWMTFVPEWLSGSTSLAGLDEPIYFWLYLTFFNVIWVIIPGWLVMLGYREMRKTWTRVEGSSYSEQKTD